MSPGASPTDNTPPPHTLSPEQVLTDLGTGSAGLTTEEARLRLARFGPNEFTPPAHAKWPAILLGQFKNLLVIILLVATAISAFLGQVVESIAIAVIVLFSILLGFIQEYRAERALAALRRLVAPTARVLRDGQTAAIATRELVPGDILVLQMGDRVAADGRLLEAINLELEEAALTGESGAIAKQTSVLSQPELVVGDRTNMVFSGTVAVYGRGRAVVCATGGNTEFGRISGLLEAIEKARTPLQTNLDRLGRVLVTLVLLVVLLITAAGLLRGAPFLEMLIFGIALGVAAVPEALPAVVTISLALGVQRMARKNALVRHLPAVETLGSTAVICADKTGTLTRDEMTVRRVLLDDQDIRASGAGYEPTGEFTRDGAAIPVEGALRELLKAATLASDAVLLKQPASWTIQGEPTEGAIVVAAAKAGLHHEALDREFPRCDELPFTSERKRMTTIHSTGNTTLAFGKGAPEVILASCDRYLTGTGPAPLTDARRKEFLEAARSMGAAALRVIGVAEKQDTHRENAETDMCFLGLLGLQDPPREAAKEAIRRCEAAGIRPVMITGDHPDTARAIAAELGLMTTGRVVTGVDLGQMSTAALKDAVADIDVYARVTPEHKLRVVDAWQKRGQVVAMTGDGINDAPALRKADVGIAMGITGTDVSREAADMTLADDNFVSIVSAVEEGRTIFTNISKYLMLLLSTNVGEIGLIGGATLLGVPLPLTAVQILYVNLATDGLPAIALSVDPPEPDQMARPPRDPRVGVFTRPVVSLMIGAGIWTTASTLGLYLWALSEDYSQPEAMTMTFLTLVLIEFFQAYSFRSSQHSILRRPFGNRWLNVAIAWELVLLTAVTNLPVLQVPFGTVSLDTDQVIIAVLTAASIVPVIELIKLLNRHYAQYIGRKTT
jgi:Ca2+-transporting ATPase